MKNYNFSTILCENEEGQFRVVELSFEVAGEEHILRAGFTTAADARKAKGLFNAVIRTIAIYEKEGAKP